MMASEACCACGGGNKATLPTPAPVENVCTDTPGWYGKCWYQRNHSSIYVRVFALSHIITFYVYVSQQIRMENHLDAVGTQTVIIVKSMVLI